MKLITVKDVHGALVDVVDLDAWAAGVDTGVDAGATICPRCSQYCFSRYDDRDELVCGYCRDIAARYPSVTDEP